MSENEAIKNVTAYVYMECENMPMQVVKALDIMKNCTKEIQAYRAIGTVEDIQLIFSLCKDLERIVKKYEEIGTIEEFRALKEKDNKDFELLLKAVKESYPIFKGAYVEFDVFMGDVMRRFTRERK